MRIILVRHGETEENVKRLLQGHLNGKLTARGQQQIGLLAERLRGERLAAIYSSDLDRAIRTAQAVNAFHHVEISPTEVLRERNLGEFEGRPIDEYITYLHRTGESRYTHAPNGGGESVGMVLDRAAEFLSTLLAKHANECVMVSSHGLFNRALLIHILGIPIEMIFALEQDNTCVNLISRKLPSDSAQELEVQLINCTRHLVE